MEFLKATITGLALLIGATCTVAASARSDDVAQVFAKVSDAVVVVRTTERTVMRGSQGRRVSLDGLGSGVLVSADGKVVTAAHVVQTADTVIVEFPDHGPIEAEVVASEPTADVALLQLKRVPDGVKL